MLCLVLCVLVGCGRISTAYTTIKQAKSEYLEAQATALVTMEAKGCHADVFYVFREGSWRVGEMTCITMGEADLETCKELCQGLALPGVGP